MRILHTMIRVGDLERSLDFYTNVLGMRVLRKTDYPEGRFTNTFVGYDDESRSAVLEFTHNWDTRLVRPGDRLRSCRARGRLCVQGVRRSAASAAGKSRAKRGR